MTSKPDKIDIEYNSQLDAFELYHLVIENSDRPSHRNGGPILPALGHALAGSVATATSKLVIYPLDLVIARLQVQKQIRSPRGGRGADTQYRGLIDAASKIYQHEGGIGAFYTGCLTDVTKGIADSFLFFLAYSFLQQRELSRTSRKHLTVPQEMGIGIVSGAFAKLITTPLQNIITRQQTAALAIAHSTESDASLKKGDKLSIAQIAKQIHQEKGLSGFWTGYSLSLILTLNPAITFAVDNFLQKVLRSKDAGASTTFIVAAVSKAVATTITYPVSVAKSRAQATRSGDESDVKKAEKTPQSTSPLSKLARLFAAQYAVLLSLRRIYQQDGLNGLYSGIEAEVLKGFLSHGLTMVMKDRVHDGIIELYYVLLRITSNWPAELQAQQEAVAELAHDARERLENVGVTAVEAGKSAAGHATEAVQNAGSSLSANTQAVLADANERAQDVATRAENIGTTIIEAGKQAVANTSESLSDAGTASLTTTRGVLAEGAARVENISTTVAEASKSLATGAADRLGGVSGLSLQAGKGVATEVSERASNIGVTTYEAGKSIANEAAARVDSLSSPSIQAGQGVVKNVSERASNIGVTTYEAGKSLVNAAAGQAANASSSTAKLRENIVSEASTRAENIGVTTVEGAKSLVRDIKKE